MFEPRSLKSTGGECVLIRRDWIHLRSVSPSCCHKFAAWSFTERNSIATLRLQRRSLHDRRFGRGDCTEQTPGNQHLSNDRTAEKVGVGVDGKDKVGQCENP